MRIALIAGSVGQPFEAPWRGPRLLPWAEYAIINWVKGALNVELRHIPIDLEAVKAAMLSSSIPGVKNWVSEWRIANGGHVPVMLI